MKRRSKPGHLLGGGGGKPQRIRDNPHAAEVEPVGVEADGEGGFGLGHAAVVDAAGGDEEFHARVVELEVAGLVEVDSELGTTRAVVGVGVFIVAAGVVEEGEEADVLLIVLWGARKPFCRLLR